MKNQFLSLSFLPAIILGFLSPLHAEGLKTPFRDRCITPFAAKFALSSPDSNFSQIAYTHLHMVDLRKIKPALKSSNLTCKAGYATVSSHLNEHPGAANISSQTSTKPLLTERDFLMRNYQSVAIATDLETDDVLALAILFDEAKRIYAETGNFPIQLIVVGEGNAAIKKMRMEKLLLDFFSPPEGVYIRIVEGKSTKENDFIYDGRELFEKEELTIAFPQEDRSLAAAKEIENWAKPLENPFIIQLKPAEELLYIDADIGKKITLLFYGSFNLRKTVPVHGTMQEVVDHISSKFKKVAILEQYGVLGNKGRVSDENRWAHKIQEKVKRADTLFLKMVKKLMNNWNAYISNKLLADCLNFPEIAQNGPLFAELQRLQTNWSGEDFRRLYPEIIEKIQDRQILRKLDVIGAISSSEVEFTLADVLVAMACTKGVDLFHAEPVNIRIDEHRFLVPEPDASSNVLYYSASDPDLIGSWFDEFLKTYDPACSGSGRL